ncbi:E3 ubiquitin-protein ligase TRIM33-like [Mercenaria mercenaria]|uniref:E3 ubiquitin-protein ligase TRIM33-like n=1 Tax=Mercenaria mercenaria TaxID=6596 RepID=UPI00234E99DB|nr:E3 ubiquitin-protein ligase TRIM33-like [Mercenaria mercenaria]
MSDSVPGKQSSEHEVEKKAEKNRNCEPCEEDGDAFPAFGFCVDCQNYLCESCFKCHCIPKPTKKHRLLNTAEMPRKKVSEDLSEICKKHEGEAIKYYCKNHNVVGCNSCMLLEHKPCQKICGLNEMAQDVETSQPYIELCNRLERIEESCEKQLANARANAEDSDLFYEKAVDKVEQLRKEMNAHFDLLHERIEKDAGKRRDINVAKMKRLIKTTESVQAEQIQIKEDLEILAETRQRKQLFIALNKSKKQVDSLQKKLSEISKENAVTKYTFKETFDVRGILGNVCSVGNLIEDKTSPTYLNSYTEFGITKRIKLSESISLVIHPIEKSIEISDNKLVIAKKVLQTTPWDACSIAVLYDDYDFGKGSFNLRPVYGYHFAVTLPDERKVKVFGYQGKAWNEEMEMKVGAKCEGIHFVENKFFIACSETAQVLILTRHGDLIRSISKDQVTGLEMFKKPAYIHYSTTAKNIYVTDRVLEEVILVSLDGKLHKVYKRNDNKQHLWALQNEYCVSSFKIF